MLARFGSLVAIAAVLGGAFAHAQPLLETTVTLGRQPAAIVLPFTVPTGGDYRITVTDFGSATGPLRLARVDAGVTRGAELVASASVTVADASGVATRTFTATAGEHRLTLIGQPNAPAARVGSAGVRIDDPVAGTVLLDTLRTFAVPPPPTPSPATFEHELAVAGGAYTLETTDFALPQALAALQTTVIRRSDGALLANVSGPAQVALTAGAADTFEVFIYAELAANVPRGLVGLNLRDGSGAVHAAEVHELGDWPYLYQVDVTAPAQVSASLTDLGFPLPLAALGAEIARDGRRVTARVAPGAPQSFAATAGRYDVYVNAAPAAGSAGSFGLRLGSPMAALLDEVRNVTTPGPATDVAAIEKTFDVATAGNYTLTLTDFGTSGFFDAFSSVALALSRDHQLLQTLTAPGTLTFAATPGRYSVAILADPLNASGEGLLGVRVAGGSPSATVLDITEAVGAEFLAATVDIASAQTVEVELADLGFPASFASLRAAVTRGAERVGEISGAGRFSFTAVPGTYHMNLLAEPDAALHYGTLGLIARVQSPVPVVTLTVAQTSVPVGSSVALTWSASHAATCRASGGWSGIRVFSGSETVMGLNNPTTFTLTCDGPGGSGSSSVAVSVTAAQRSGGGGAADIVLLALLAASLLGARRRGAPRFSRRR